MHSMEDSMTQQRPVPEWMLFAPDQSDPLVPGPHVGFPVLRMGDWLVVGVVYARVTDPAHLGAAGGALWTEVYKNSWKLQFRRGEDWPVAISAPQTAIGAPMHWEAVWGYTMVHGLRMAPPDSPLGLVLDAVHPPDAACPIQVWRSMLYLLYVLRQHLPERDEIPWLPRGEPRMGRIHWSPSEERKGETAYFKLGSDQVQVVRTPHRFMVRMDSAPPVEAADGQYMPGVPDPEGGVYLCLGSRSFGEIGSRVYGVHPGPLLPELHKILQSDLPIHKLGSISFEALAAQPEYAGVRPETLRRVLWGIMFGSRFATVVWPDWWLDVDGTPLVTVQDVD